MIKFLKKFGLKFKNNKISLPAWCKRIKIDVGLSDGAPQSRRWLDNQSDLVVFCFEPAFINYSRIIKDESKYSVSLNPKDIGKRAYVINCGFGNVNSMVKRNFYITSGDQGCSSLFKPKQFKILKKEIVTIFPIDEFTKLLPFDEIKYIDHIKSDCQGSDLDILKKGSFTLGKTAVYTIEALELDQKLYFGCKNNLSEIRKIFYKNGFSEYNFFNKCFDSKTNNFNVSDPTFYNKKILEKTKEKIFIYQSSKNIYLKERYK